MNNKILSVVLVTGIAATGFAGISAASDTDSVFGKMLGKNSEIRQILEKQEAGESLTQEEQTILESFEAERSQRESQKAGFGKRSGFGNLTDEEKTALESMTDEEKQAFFEAKKVEMNTQREAHKTVIDKLIAGESLTADEEQVREEMLSNLSTQDGFGMRDNAGLIEKLLKGETLTADEETTLSDMQAKKAQREEKRAQIEAIKVKQEAGETLTEDEQALLDSMPIMSEEMRTGKNMRERMNHEDSEDSSSEE